MRVLRWSTDDLAIVSTFLQVRELFLGLFPRRDLTPLHELKHLERLTLVGPQVPDWTLTPDLGAFAKLRLKSLELVRCFRGDELAPKIAKSVSTTGCTLRH